MTEPELESVPLGEVAYRHIRDDIITCRLPPGHWFTERQLADETGLGISPVREALTRLDQEGLVRTLPRKGYQVKPLTIKAINDLFEYWEFLCPEIIRRGIAGATREQIEQAIAGFGKLMQLFSEEGSDRDLRHDAQHLVDEAFTVLAEGTHNDYFIGSYHRVSTAIARVWALIGSDFVDGADVGEYLTETGKWPDVLARRDSEAGAENVRRFIRQSHNRVLRTLARWPSIVTAEILPLNQSHTTAGSA